MDELEQILGQTYDGQDAGNTAVADPPDADSGAPADTGEPTGEGQPVEADVTPFRWENVPPELEPLAKGFQGDYTRAMQEVRAKEKALEAQQQEFQAWQQFNQMAQEDPAQAAARLQATADYLRQMAGGQPQPEPETDPLEGYFAQTDGEQFLADQLRALNERNAKLEARLNAQERFVTEQQQQQALGQIKGEFDALERKFGVTLAQDERNRIAAYCVQRQIGNVEDGYKAYDYDKALARSIQRGRDEASGVVARKSNAAPAPTLLAQRKGADAEPKMYKDLNEALAATWSDLSEE